MQFDNQVLYYLVASRVTTVLHGGLTRSRFGRVVHRKSGCEQRLCETRLLQRTLPHSSGLSRRRPEH